MKKSLVGRQETSGIDPTDVTKLSLPLSGPPFLLLGGTNGVQSDDLQVLPALKVYIPIRKHHQGDCTTGGLAS